MRIGTFTLYLFLCTHLSPLFAKDLTLVLDKHGYNVGEGGEGWTSEEGNRFGTIGGDVSACRAGHPQRRVLAALRAATKPQTTAEYASLLNISVPRVNRAIIQHPLARARDAQI